MHGQAADAFCAVDAPSFAVAPEAEVARLQSAMASVATSLNRVLGGGVLLTDSTGASAVVDEAAVIAAELQLVPKLQESYAYVESLLEVSASAGTPHGFLMGYPGWHL